MKCTPRTLSECGFYPHDVPGGTENLVILPGLGVGWGTLHQKIWFCLTCFFFFLWMFISLFSHFIVPTFYSVKHPKLQRVRSFKNPCINRGVIFTFQMPSCVSNVGIFEAWFSASQKPRFANLHLAVVVQWLDYSIVG